MNLLRECIENLNLQTILPQRIIVIDNGSNDGSDVIINKPKNLKVIKLNNNLGFAAGNNRGIAECTTKFVALLNPDAFPASDWIEKLLNASEEYPDLASFGSKQVCYGNETILDGIGDKYHLSGLFWRNRHGKHERPQDKIAKEIFSPCAAAAMYRRSILEEVGGLDEDYFCYGEDVDLGFRLRLAGYKSIYVPDAVVLHVGSATTGGQHSNFAVYHGHRNIVWTFVKNMPGRLFWLFLPLHLLLNIISLGVFWRRGQLRLILKSKWDAIKGIPNAWRKRRKVQADRVASIKSIWKALDRHIIPPK